MNCIPNSYIKQERNREIKKLPLPYDIINKIVNYDSDFINIDSCIDTFWINLGKETCNLDMWSWYCYDIFQKSFGKTRFKFVYDIRYKLFINLKDELDKLVCNYYPRNITSIENIPLIHIFYNNYDIIKYPVRNIDKSKKYITTDEQIYIMTFIKRINVYLKYIENNIDKFSINLNIYNYTSKEVANIKKNIIKTISKIKKKCDKLSIIMNDIQVK